MDFDNIVIGATFFGCGLSCALSGRTLVLEQSIVPGSDFSLQFDSINNWYSDIKNKEASEFKEELVKRRALDESGAVCTAALAPLLAAWCDRHGVTVEYSCDVLQHDETNVVAVGVDGPKQYSAGRIFDVRPRQNEPKYLTALITAPSSMKDGGKGPFDVRQSIIKGEFHLSFQVPHNATWSMARAMFHRAWDMRPLSLKYSSILLIGTRFSFRIHNGPLHALDEGLSFGRRMQ